MFIGQRVLAGACVLGVAAAVIGAGSQAGAAVQATTSTGGANTAPAVSNTDLLQTAVSGVTSIGNFTLGDDGPIATFGLPKITDGSFGAIDGQNHLGTVGASGGRGTLATYDLDLTASPAGYDLTGIDIVGGWGDPGRDEIKVQILYSTVAAPGTFVPLTLAQHNGDGGFPHSWNRISITDTTGTLATGVAAVQFNFDQNPENGWVGVREIDVFGAAAVPEPTGLFGAVAAGALAFAGRRTRRPGA